MYNQALLLKDLYFNKNFSEHYLFAVLETIIWWLWEKEWGIIWLWWLSQKSCGGDSSFCTWSFTRLVFLLGMFLLNWNKYNFGKLNSCYCCLPRLYLNFWLRTREWNCCRMWCYYFLLMHNQNRLYLIIRNWWKSGFIFVRKTHWCTITKFHVLGMHAVIYIISCGSLFVSCLILCPALHCLTSIHWIWISPAVWVPHT